MEWITNPEVWASFLTLSVLEIVLGIDNIIFLSIISARLPKAKRAFARTLGLSLALVMRIVLLSAIAWLSHLNTPAFTVLGHEFTWNELVLLGGGLFLLYKATTEIHYEMEGKNEAQEKRSAGDMMFLIICQIVAIDLVFSLDSIFTAVGVAEHVPVMVAAIVVAILVMLFASGPISDFVIAHPSVKMLALGFLILVGMVLVADAFEFHIPRGYLYFAIAFSLSTETLNLVANSKRDKRHGGRKHH